MDNLTRHRIGDRPDTNSRVGRLLDVAWRSGGTDVLLTVGIPPQMRVNGSLVAMPGEPILTPDDTAACLGELLLPIQAESWQPDRELDFSFDWSDVRVRANGFSQQGHIALAMRMLPRRIPTLAELGMPAVLSDMCRMHQGLVLVTGPTGSGKSTTLAAMVNQINQERACHILIIEDPIEYIHQHQRSVVNQRQVGTDTASFAAALRAALRSDPDVLLVGEMRDTESIATALTVAETGHLVLTTLHTNDAAQTVSRIIDAFPAEQQAQIRTQLAAAISGIVYQRLIPRIGGGVTAAFEILVANTAVRNIIKEGKTHMLRNSLVTGQRDGMITFETSLNALIRAGIVTYEDAVVRSLHPADLERPYNNYAGTRP